GRDYRRDPARVLSVLAAMDPDIVALQEVDRRFGRRTSSLPPAMITAETDLEIVDLAHRPESIGWHGNAILLRRGTKVLDIHTLALQGLEPRGAVVVDLENLRVVGVHLALLRRARQAQVAQIAAFLARMPYKPTLIMGDFNEWSRQSRNLSALDAQFNLHTPGHSFPSSKPLVGLDKIALSRELSFENGGVHSCEAARKASDHMPIWADISLQTI
ncbi:MAG TPA: metal-dependent hydrolase, partial [Rhodobacteraceae bacterium]|nr:metal-dependent hydrolase [Paracoccaceae bacterium]